MVVYNLPILGLAFIIQRNCKSLMFNPKQMYLLETSISKIITPDLTDSNHGDAIKEGEKGLRILRNSCRFPALLAQYATRHQAGSITRNHKQLALLQLSKIGLQHYISQKYVWENIVYFYYYHSDQFHHSTILQLLKSQIKICLSDSKKYPIALHKQAIMDSQIFSNNLPLIAIIKSFLQIIFSTSEWAFSHMTKLMLALTDIVQSCCKHGLTMQNGTELINYLFEYGYKLYGIVADEFGLYYRQWLFICMSKLFCQYGGVTAPQRQQFYKKADQTEKGFQQQQSLYIKVVINLVQQQNLQETFANKLHIVIKNLLLVFQKQSTKKTSQSEMCLMAINVLNYLVASKTQNPQILENNTQRSCLFEKINLSANEVSVENILGVYIDHILRFQSKWITFAIKENKIQNNKKHRKIQSEEDMNYLEQEEISFGTMNHVQALEHDPHSHQKYAILSYIVNQHYQAICHQILNANQLNLIASLVFVEINRSEFNGPQQKIIKLIIQTFRLLLHHNNTVSIQLVGIMLLYLSRNIQTLFICQANTQQTCLEGQHKQPLAQLIYLLLQLPILPIFHKSQYCKIILLFLNSIINEAILVLPLQKIQQIYYYSMTILRRDPLSLTIDSFYVPLILLNQMVEQKLKVEGQAEVWIVFMEITQFFEEQPTNSMNFQLSYLIANVATQMLKQQGQPIDIVIIKLGQYYEKNRLFSAETGIILGFSMVKQANYTQFLDKLCSTQIVLNQQIANDDVGFYVSAASTILSMVSQSKYVDKLGQIVVQFKKYLLEGGECQKQRIIHKLDKQLEKLIDYFDSNQLLQNILDIMLHGTKL